jgi:hypothetical protein
VHWTNDQWTCGYCGVAVNRPHEEGCAVRNTTNTVVWFGPPVTPGMLPRQVVNGDVAAQYLTCLHCDETFKSGEVVFENRAQSSGIHGECILQLARMIPRELASPDEVEAEFERRRAEIFDRP